MFPAEKKKSEAKKKIKNIQNFVQPSSLKYSDNKEIEYFNKIQNENMRTYSINSNQNTSKINFNQANYYDKNIYQQNYQIYFHYNQCNSNNNNWSCYQNNLITQNKH